MPYKNKENKKVCNKKSHQKYYLKNKEKILANNKQWHKNHPESFNKYFKQWKEKNKERYLELIKAWRKTSKGKYKEYRDNAKRRGFIFNITLDEFTKLLNEPCYYCGEKSDGLDRLDSLIGYLIDNIVPCCSMCNFMKQTYTEEEFVNQCMKIANFNLHKKTKKIEMGS